MEDKVIMENQIKKSKKPMVLGILSLVAWIFPIIGLIVSTFGIVISSKRLKEVKCKAYKIGLVLNILGMTLTVLNIVLAFYLYMNNMA
ncbi:hypothetical protein [Romboutsia lituseburensis]|uniref:hypothetical protein n=1 Tax=Romboutsia lituseburensis TaxID=1537 RepID=UPI00215A1EE9|nr:hypothetical protein [Romboutsia lituseburensis]MCR8745705.1 hypothetical protein [Romboutsia lituseburensis]